MDANKRKFLPFACIRVYSRPFAVNLFFRAVSLVWFVVSSIIENFANDYIFISLSLSLSRCPLSLSLSGTSARVKQAVKPVVAVCRASGVTGVEWKKATAKRFGSMPS